jgi:hypothetical protein
MTDYAYPLSTASSLVERIESVPDGAASRRWVLRDDNQQHYHNRISLADDPTYLELVWKPSVRGREQVVGVYRLHLAQLLAGGYVRREPDGLSAEDIRLRFVHGHRGVVSIQARQDQPSLPIGMVDLTLG